MLTAGGKTFTYDSENHLLSMGSTVGLMYDGDGNRVAKSVNGATTYYLVDDLNPTGYSQVVEELSGTGAVTRQYSYGLQRISEQQAISNTWTPSFYGYDGGESVRALTNAAGAVTDSYEYDAFGNSFTVSGSTPNNYLYRGEQYDPDLGLYYLRARYYNPLTGRFMSRDPEEHSPNSPNDLHRYLYAAGDPVNGIDPTGRGDDEIDYAALTFNRVKAVLRDFGPFWMNCFANLINTFSRELEILDYKDPAAFEDLLARISASCLKGLFFNSN